jgi:Zn-dependent M28 family amino/carboxypeptidase
VAQSPIPIDRIVAMLNFDMVGRLRNDLLIVYGVETAAEMRSIIDSAAVGTGLEIRGVGDGFGPSDHSSFYARGIPVLHFFTDLHEDYHRATDDADKVSAAGIGRVVTLAERVVRAVADRDARRLSRADSRDERA